MAKIYQDALPPETGRAYQITDNEDGTKKIEDVTKYAQTGSTFGSADVLETCTLVFEHSKSGTVHNFANPNPDARLGRAKMTANVEAGDTFQINGTPVTAYMGTEDATDSMAGSSWNGKWVSFVFDGTAINFKGGGGLPAADKAKLIPENIKSGVTLFAGTPKQVVGIFTDDGNASPINIVAGISAYSRGKKVDGTLPRYTGSEKIVPATYDIIITNSPIYMDRKVYVSGDPKLVAGNIRKGVSIFGVVGTLTPAPESGTFYGYNGAVSYNSINPMLGSLSPGPVCIRANTVSNFAAPNRLMLTGGTNITTPTVYWFTNRLDFSKYSSIVIWTNGYPWEGWRSFTFGVGRTTNLNEWLAYTTASIGKGENKEVVVDVKNVNEFGYIKWQTSNGYSQFMTSLAVNV